MRKTQNYAFFIVFVILLSCAVTEDLPEAPFFPGLIMKFESGPEESMPDEIWSFLIGDNVVFYVAAVCCDIPGTLYDKDGNILCHPDGGVTGLGDGNCPRFHTERGAGLLIWRDPRIGDKKDAAKLTL